MDVLPGNHIEGLEEDIRAMAPEGIPALLGELERLRAIGYSRLLTPAPNNGDDGDRLVDVTEAARLLCVSEDHLYREASTYPFTVKLGRRLRFSRKGIQDYLQSLLDG